MSFFLKKFYFILFTLFQLFSLFFWSKFILFIFISLFFSFWIFFEFKMRFEVLGAYALLVVLFCVFFYTGNPNKVYDEGGNIKSGYYTISDFSGLNRSNNPIYKENKYIVYNEVNAEKIIINCSLLLIKCGVGNDYGDKVFVEYIRYCKRTTCDNYIYKLKTENAYFDEKYFKSKYSKEQGDILCFLVVYFGVVFSCLAFYSFFAVKKS